MMNGTAWRLFMGLVMVTGMLITSGCGLALLGTGVGAGAATVAYVKGELRAAEDVKLDQAWRATQATLRDMGYAVVERSEGDREASLVARKGQNDPDVTVRLTQTGSNVTEFRVRVGVFGNEEQSRSIMDRIRTRLGRPTGANVIEKQADKGVKRKVVGVESPDATAEEPKRFRVEGVVVQPE